MLSHRAMLPGLALAVNLALVGLAACTSSSPVVSGPAAAPFGAPKAEAGAVDPRVTHFLTPPTGPLGARLGDFDPPAARASLTDDDTVIDALTEPVEDGELVTEGLGGEVEEALDAARAEGRSVRDGVASLDIDTLWGWSQREAACESPRVAFDARQDGETWRVDFGVQMYTVFATAPEPMWSTMSSDCADALLAAGGDVGAVGGDCTDPEIEGFFPEGSDCRACLEGGGGEWDACVEDGACRDRMPTVGWSEATGERVWWQQASAWVLACAPDYLVQAVMFARIDADGNFPAAFDHANWDSICFPFYWADEGGEDYYCLDGYDEGRDGDALGQGVHGVIHAITRDGDDREYHRHRTAFTPRAEIDGYTLRYSWEWMSGYGILSHPVYGYDLNGDGVYDANDAFFGTPWEGWGLAPMTLRPDGQDPDDVDDTYARDWLAATTLKTATTRAGVNIQMSNHSRCQDWDDLADGTSRCTAMGVPEDGWLTDGVMTWWDTDYGNTFVLPVATLASTGLADPDIPGGIVPYVAGSPTLADPEFDDCTWSHTFAPDQEPFNDTPLDWSGQASLWGDGWKFGKPDAPDYRLVLYTDVARDYCPDGAAP